MDTNRYQIWIFFCVYLTFSISTWLFLSKQFWVSYLNGKYYDCFEILQIGTWAKNIGTNDLTWKTIIKLHISDLLWFFCPTIFDHTLTWKILWPTLVSHIFVYEFFTSSREIIHTFRFNELTFRVCPVIRSLYILAFNSCNCYKSLNHVKFFIHKEYDSHIAFCHAWTRNTLVNVLSSNVMYWHTWLEGCPMQVWFWTWPLYCNTQQPFFV